MSKKKKHLEGSIEECISQCIKYTYLRVFKAGKEHSFALASKQWVDAKQDQRQEKNWAGGQLGGGQVHRTTASGMYKMVKICK